MALRIEEMPFTCFETALAAADIHGWLIAHKNSCYFQFEEIHVNLKYSLQIWGNMTFKISEMHICWFETALDAADIHGRLIAHKMHPSHILFKLDDKVKIIIFQELHFCQIWWHREEFEMSKLIFAKTCISFGFVNRKKHGCSFEMQRLRTMMGLFIRLHCHSDN